MSSPMRQTVKVTVEHEDSSDDSLTLFLNSDEVSELRKTIAGFRPPADFVDFCASYCLSYESGYRIIKVAKSISDDY